MRLMALKQICGMAIASLFYTYLAFGLYCELIVSTDIQRMSQNRLAIAMPQICFNAINRMYCNLIAFQDIYFADRSSVAMSGACVLPV